MKKLFLFISIVFFISLFSVHAQARCAYYVGYGYRCFGDEGGTGGKVFKDMDANTKKCGYWDPGCQKSGQKNNTQPSPSTEAECDPDIPDEDQPDCVESEE